MVGISPLEFWDYTPKELNIMIEAYQEKCTKELENNIIFAYYTALFSRQKKLSKLSNILKSIRDKSETTAMDANQMYEVAKMVAAKMKKG